MGNEKQVKFLRGLKERLDSFVVLALDSAHSHFISLGRKKKDSFLLAVCSGTS